MNHELTAVLTTALTLAQSSDVDAKRRCCAELEYASTLMILDRDDYDDATLDMIECDWQHTFREVWSSISDIKLRDRLMLAYSMHNAMMATEELRRYAEMRDYTDAWRDAGTRFYECMDYLEAKRDIKGYDAEVVESLWSQGHRHQLDMLKRCDEMIASRMHAI